MNHKLSFWGKHRFYKLEQAMELLTNMSDCEDESTSESENEGDSSDSSEEAPEQHQVRTDSNILMPKETEVFKAKEIPNKGRKAAPKPVDNQSATKCALLADQTATTLDASPAKVSKAKEIPNKGQKAAPKPVDNQSVTKHALLADQTATTLGASPAKVSKVSKAKEIPKKGQKAAPKLVDNQSATKAMASDSDIDVEDYYVIEDANDSDSSEYVPCINYTNDKVYPEDVKNGWVRLEQDTGPPNIYRFEGSCHNYLNLNNYTPGAVFDEFFEGNMWTILSENTNKYVHAILREAKDKGDKDPIELLSEGADQNPCARLNKWEDTSPDEMKVFVAHLIVMGILKKNFLKQYWSRDSILNMPFFGHYMSRYHFQNILWNLHVSDPDETNPPKGEADHDPLFLVRPMVDMMQRNFCTKYSPGKELSLDESMCPFKGRVHCKCYNPKKPNRFHIKLFMVSEPSTVSICGFEVYTGDASGQSQGNVQEVQDASKTSCTVLGLLDSAQLLDMGHHVYFDNYYNSPDLIDLLYKRKTHACGTVRKN